MSERAIGSPATRSATELGKGKYMDRVTFYINEKKDQSRKTKRTLLIC